MRLLLEPFQGSGFGAVGIRGLWFASADELGSSTENPQVLVNI